MKRIIFDLLCAQPQNNVKYHGGGEYTKAIFLAILMHSNETNISFEICFNPNVFIDDWIKDIIKEKKLKVHAVTNEIEIASVLNNLDCLDEITFFSGLINSYSDSNISLPKNVRKVGTLHGLRVIEKPYDNYGYLYYSKKNIFKEYLRKTLFKNYLKSKYFMKYKEAVENFDIIITVSEFSATSLRINLKKAVENKEIYTLYTPVKPSIQLNPFVKSDESRFILIVSGDRWLKNAYRAIQAIDNLYEKGFADNIKVKVYGNYPNSLRKKIKNKSNFSFFGYVSSEELEHTYYNCDIFLYPTLNEGFGLPPMEAMKYGKTCVISAVSSLPEIYGDSVYYFNPYDTLEMENKILYSLENKIDVSVIKDRLEYIKIRQEKDLEELCKIILQ